MVTVVALLQSFPVFEMSDTLRRYLFVHFSLLKVEKIVTGEVEAEKTRELYRNKRRQANILTRKMDQRDIDEMETKLEQTGMGVLFNREQYRVLSSKEEKVICYFVISLSIK